MVTNDEPNGINFNCALIKKGLATPQEDEGYLQEPYEFTEFNVTTSSMDSFQVNISNENENDDALEDHDKVVNKDFVERPSEDVCIVFFPLSKKLLFKISNLSKF